MSTAILIISITLLALLAARAIAVPAPQVDRIEGLRKDTNTTRNAKCLRPIRRSYVPAHRVPEVLRPYTIVVEKRRRKNAKAAKGRCLPTTVVGIIRYVFPDATEDAAIRVADCESHLTARARNPSGASGVFQLMPFWWAGRFDPFDPWANIRAALRISSGGWNWSAWVCRP